MRSADEARVLDAEDAPAKINLALHVTGRRPDGYHELDSLVVFATAGDRLERLDRGPPLALAGRFAAELETLAPADNLVLKAVAALGLPPAPLRLDKRLPVASGLGGGSADAAAAIRLLARSAGAAVDPGLAGRRPLAPGPFADEVRRLGADVPMCLLGRPVRAGGIGERLALLPGLPTLPLVLVNPGAAVSTPAVFARLERRDNPPLPDLPAAFADAAALAAWLAATRNDLEAPAIALEPSIATALGLLRSRGDCLAARMSGSGATVFGLFPDEPAAARAAAAIAAARPDWWVVATIAPGTVAEPAATA